MTTRYEEDFSQSLNSNWEALGFVALHHVDSSWLSGNFADFVILASYVCLALVHMESALFGIGNFSLGMFFSTIGVYKIMKSSVTDLCSNCRKIEGGVTRMNSVSDLLNR